MITSVRLWARTLLFSGVALALCQPVQAQFSPDSFTDTLQDGQSGPQMVIVPGGEFKMGDHNGNGPDDEKPVRQISLQAFALSRFEVTFAEFDRFVAATSKRPPDDAQFGRGKMPVINVTWEDANAYAHWLSQQTGMNYHLPSEAQWEFASRAGTSTTYFWGTDVNQACFYANVADTSAANSNSDWLQVNCEDGYQGLAPVGQFPPNPYGLYDIVGNVYEWVQDCYSDSYEVLAKDGRAHENSFCRRRVARGGAWSSPSWELRASHRHSFPPNERRNTLGFRVVRDLTPQELAQLGHTSEGHGGDGDGALSAQLALFSAYVD